MNKKLPLLLLVCLSTLLSYAKGIKFNENKAWKEILAIAKKENFFEWQNLASRRQPTKPRNARRCRDSLRRVTLTVATPSAG